MRFSLMTEPHMGGTYDQQLEAARWAESEGLVSFARCDHYLSGADPTPDATDAFAVLAGLARETSDIRLCVLVTPITFRHPAVIAKNAATIAQMSGGRLDLGVGTGWMDLEHEALGMPFPDWSGRWSRFEEALDYLDAAFGSGHGSYEGEHYSLDADVKPKPTGLRTIIGGGGEKRTPTLAGTRADEYNTFIRPPEDARRRIEVMRDAAGDREVEATVMGPALVGRTDAEYQDRLAAAAAKRETSPEDLEKRYADAGIVLGTPERAAESVAALEEAGVERFYVQWLDLDDLDTMKDTVAIVRGG
ncbi:MAG TPA: LLM class flavin-dependent oxidoreductase [Acidimicrobiia bacterium]|nr:LLM class flavin-dependent oxidoreductase [Acidimicrobiia bacterium]